MWTAPRVCAAPPPWDRLAFTFAAYNAGIGTVLRQQRACAAARGRSCNGWDRIAPWLWEEPRAYVARIGRWCARLKAPGPACAPARQ